MINAHWPILQSSGGYVNIVALDQQPIPGCRSNQQCIMTSKSSTKVFLTKGITSMWSTTTF